MKRLVFDLDGTIARHDPALPYAERDPDPQVVETLRRYHAEGFEIIIATARNMRTHEGNVGRINVQTLPVILAWLERHGIPYDEVHVGKPWCGDAGFYIDDRAVRPSEFVTLSYTEILKRLESR